MVQTGAEASVARWGSGRENPLGLSAIDLGLQFLLKSGRAIGILHDRGRIFALHTLNLN